MGLLNKSKAKTSKKLKWANNSFSHMRRELKNLRNKIKEKLNGTNLDNGTVQEVVTLQEKLQKLSKTLNKLGNKTVHNNKEEDEFTKKLHTLGQEKLGSLQMGLSLNISDSN